MFFIILHVFVRPPPPVPREWGRFHLGCIQVDTCASRSSEGCTHLGYPGGAFIWVADGPPPLPSKVCTTVPPSLVVCTRQWQVSSYAPQFSQFHAFFFFLFFGKFGKFVYCPPPPPPPTVGTPWIHTCQKTDGSQ